MQSQAENAACLAFRLGSTFWRGQMFTASLSHFLEDSFLFPKSSRFVPLPPRVTGQMLTWDDILQLCTSGFGEGVRSVASNNIQLKVIKT